MKPLSILFVALLSATVAQAADSPLNLRRTTTVQVVEKTKDAVVYISTTKLVTQRYSPFGNDPRFQQFDFGSVAVPTNSLGSGFIVHHEGYIVTNNHVIDRALGKISVELLDGRKFDAELISADADADLAILRIHTDKPLPSLELGDSSDLMPGEPVIAVGNPLGFTHSVSTGIVSALHRELKGPGNQVMASDLIQTDAAINPGNSGGPLLNAYGQVIGINTAIRGDAQNIGFAIQVNALRDLIPDLMNPAHAAQLKITLKLKESRKITAPATVTATVERADGEQVLSIAGVKPRDIVDAYAILLKQKEGQSFEVALQGKPAMKVEVKSIVAEAVLTAKNKLGVTVEPLSPAAADQLRGLLVKEVVPESAAAKFGIQRGDIIVRLGQVPMARLANFTVAMEKLPDTGQVLVLVVRGETIGQGMLHF